ncbi:hypothetical protein [Yoonia sp.]|uniref:hypothetical protein n=1 Tax=Yoonia sp. TaxID=2212373 RepID=UPI002E01B0FB|nr:hypothetical protein [Yoonia sp.]
MEAGPLQWPNVQPPTLSKNSNNQKLTKESSVIAKLTKLSQFTTAQPRAETTLEKTTRMAKDITEQEVNKRQEKIARLRKARHENEAEDATTNASEPRLLKNSR